MTETTSDQGPGPGLWFSAAEHVPQPLTTMYGELIAVACTGMGQGVDAFGLPADGGQLGMWKRWAYYSPGIAGSDDVEGRDRTAAATLATERWRGELDEWESVRPAAVAASRALLAEDLESCSDAELADHVERAIAHCSELCPGHFAAMPAGSVAIGVLLEAAEGWGLDAREVVEALAGRAGATASAEQLFDRLAALLTEAGITDLQDLAQIDGLGGEAAAVLDELRQDYAWRVVRSIAEPTLAERPDAVVAAIRAAQRGRGVRHRPAPERLAALRSRVPAADHARFDDLVAVAQRAYAYNDDNTTVLFALPLGLVRRAALEIGRRQAATGRLHDAEDALEASCTELPLLALGQGPTADELAARTAERRAADPSPPPMVGSPLPPSPEPAYGPSTQRLAALRDRYRGVAFAPAAEPTRAAATVGDAVVRGRAVVADDPLDALVRMEPGDVLVAVTTTAAFNTIFPAAAGVAVEQGNVVCHAAVLARELGLPAVIGLPGLLERVHDGDLVELDPVAGTITVVG